MTALTRAARLTGYETLARSLGVDPRQELQRVGIPLRSLENPDALINYESFLRLLENTAVKGNCVDFGLRLSQSQDLSVLGPLAVLIGHARTIAEAADFASRYLFVHTPGNRITLAPVPLDPALTDVIFSIDMVGKAPRRQGFELGLAYTARTVRMLGRGAIRPCLALLPHARLAPLSSYRTAFGCPTEFDSTTAALRFATADVERPLPEHDPMLKRLAQTYLDQNFPKGKELISDSVRELVRQFLSVGQATQQTIASALSIHPRALQRKLVSEGFRFIDIVDDVRRNLLVEMLDRSARPNLMQVSLTLGYSEQAALSRSCQRWFKCSPTELHRRRRVARGTRQSA
jgi:AraC-like DNA-binding protein